MPHSDSPPTSDPKRRKQNWGKIGIGLILVSGVLWFSLFAIPFLPLTVGQKAALAGAVFVGVQIAWWSGAALAGPQTVAKLWRRRTVTKADDSQLPRHAGQSQLSRCDVSRTSSACRKPRLPGKRYPIQDHNMADPRCGIGDQQTAFSSGHRVSPKNILAHGNLQRTTADRTQKRQAISDHT